MLKKVLASKRKASKRARWEPEELALLERFYANVPNPMIAKKLGRHTKAIANKASQLGLKKSRAFHRMSGRMAQEKRWRGEDPDWLKHAPA